MPRPGANSVETGKVFALRQTIYHTMARLRHVKSTIPGYTRGPLRSGRGKRANYSYFNEQGKRIRDPETLARIASLVIPPAWTEVWICPYPNGHLQATGIDQRGRKQYIYHPNWKKAREETKYSNLLEFGKQLPRIRRQIRKDLRKRLLVKEKVTAIALMVMEETLIRVGNVHYQQVYGSHGLTTLRNNHVRINGSRVTFKFKGKKGVLHEIDHRDQRLARFLKKIKELPGQELFQYYDPNGELRTLDSGDVNEYIFQCTQCDFTSKDYRTWAGSVQALKAMAACPPDQSLDACRKSTVKIIDEVAARLGNTPAVCKKYYIYPELLDVTKRKKLLAQITRVLNRKDASGGLLNKEEKALLHLLKLRVKKE